MKTIKTLMLAAMIAGAATSALAQHRGAELGMLFRDAVMLYPSARQVPASAAEPARLELTDLDYADTHWATVDLVFDRYGKLDRVQLFTRDRSFQQVKAQVVAQLNEDFAPDHGRRLMANAVSALQVRICDRGDAGVVLTYERPNQPA